MSVAFCVGTGRCGTTFLTELAAQEPGVAASHERLRLAATFHMYCQWNRIPVDDAGFLVDRILAVEQDLAEHDVSFEASALLSHSVAALDRAFEPRWVLLVRHPADTIASFAVRGWFEDLAPRDDPDRPPSYRQGEEPRHFFGRLLPRSAEEHARFAASTPLGRIAWFWQARIGAILDQLARLPPGRVRIQRLEELDHAAYVDLAAFLGWSCTIDEPTFARIADRRPNTGPNRPRPHTAWSETERHEYERHVGDIAARLGYTWRLGALESGVAPITRPCPPPALLSKGEQHLVRERTTTAPLTAREVLRVRHVDGCRIAWEGATCEIEESVAQSGRRDRYTFRTARGRADFVDAYVDLRVSDGFTPIATPVKARTVCTRSGTVGALSGKPLAHAALEAVETARRGSPSLRRALHRALFHDAPGVGVVWRGGSVRHLSIGHDPTRHHQMDLDHLLTLPVFETLETLHLHSVAELPDWSSLDEHESADDIDWTPTSARWSPPRLDHVGPGLKALLALRISGATLHDGPGAAGPYVDPVEQLRLDDPLPIGHGVGFAMVWGGRRVRDLWMTHAPSRYSDPPFRRLREVLEEGQWPRLQRLFIDHVTPDGSCPPELATPLAERGIRWEAWPFPGVPLGTVTFDPPAPAISPPTVSITSLHDLLRHHDEVREVLEFGRRPLDPDHQWPRVDRVSMLEQLDATREEDEHIVLLDDEPAPPRGPEEHEDLGRQAHEDLRGGWSVDGWFDAFDLDADPPE